MRKEQRPRFYIIAAMERFQKAENAVKDAPGQQKASKEAAKLRKTASKKAKKILREAEALKLVYLTKPLTK
jgi:cell division septum initiation protein DivIVA